MAVTFLSRGDTMTPVKALFFAVAVNVALKVLLYESYAQVGLAFATSIGAWVNLVLLWWFAARAGLISFDERLRRSVIKLAAAGAALALALILGKHVVALLFVGWSTFHAEAMLVVLVIIGALVYGGIVLTLFGQQWLAAFRGRKRAPTPPPMDIVNE
jgi:putative peptidoglycan lipid II flippase